MMHHITQDILTVQIFRPQDVQVSCGSAPEPQQAVSAETHASAVKAEPSEQHNTSIEPGGGQQPSQQKPIWQVITRGPLCQLTAL